jgi:hypothetical protein
LNKNDVYQLSLVNIVSALNVVPIINITEDKKLSKAAI